MSASLDVKPRSESSASGGNLATRLFQVALKGPKSRAALWVAAVVLGIIGLALTAGAYAWVIPQLYEWGFQPLSWKAIAAGLAIGLVAIFGWTPLMPAGFLGVTAAEAVVENDKAQAEAALTGIQTAQEKLENELAQRDRAGIGLVLRLSRLHLDKWNAVSLTQNQRSFRYAILAMWVGFGILAIGLASAFGLPGLNTQTDTLLDVNVVVLASGAIIEFVSGMFLWIYRSSQTQFRYFYDRQMSGYSIYMAYNVAESMTSPDECKSDVVHTLLRAFSDSEGGLPTDAAPALRQPAAAATPQ